MTKWQESCITALASSPMAWEAFKMKQRNRKLLWQYINRIWPYKLIAGTKVNKNKKDLLAIARILKNLSSTIQYVVLFISIFSLRIILEEYMSLNKDINKANLCPIV